MDDSVTKRAPQAAQPRLATAYGKLPLSFEINRGQTDPQVKFLSRGSGYSLFLTGSEAVLALKKPGARSRSQQRHLSGLHIRVAQTSLLGLRLFRGCCDHP